MPATGGLWWKHTLFDESAKVPLLISMPGALPEGVVNADVVGLMDLAQTMIDALGGETLPGADGRSFWPRMTGSGQDWDDTVTCEYCTDAVPAWTGGRAVRHRMVRQGRWKLHVYPGERPLLFDLDADPQESRDLAGEAGHAGTLARLMARALDGWDPEAIAETMRVRRERKDVLAAWARRTEPPSAYLWPLRPEMNRLDPA